MVATNNSSRSGIGIFGLLGLVFVTLKLTGHIDWSWWWVTLPFWGFLGVIAAIALIGTVVVVIAAAIKRGTDK